MKQVKHWIVIVLIVALVGVAWAGHAASVQRRADEMWTLADEECRRFDFRAAHAHLLVYLQLRPERADDHLLAARCARRAEFIEDYVGPDAELREMAAKQLATAERLGALPSAVALERILGSTQHGDLAGNERTLIDCTKPAGADSPLILEALVHSYVRHLQCEKALVCAESLLQLEPDNALALLWRGRIREQINQARSARQDYESALRFVPDFDAARYYLAESLLRSNQPGPAEAHLRILESKAGENLLVRLAWAKCLIARGDGSVGQGLLDAWLADAPKHHPRLLEALNARAGLALASGRLTEAEEFARRALQESPLDRYALYDLARSLNAQERKKEARAIEEQLDRIKRDLHLVAQCRERLAREPANLGLRHEIGAAYLRLDRPGEAFVWLNSVLDRDPNHGPTLHTLADYHAQAGKEPLAGEMRRRFAAGP